MTARAVSKHRRVCGQNYGQIPVLAQKKSPVTGMVTGLFTVIAKHYRYRSKPQFAEKIIGRIYLPTSNL